MLTGQGHVRQICSCDVDKTLTKAHLIAWLWSTLNFKNIKGQKYVFRLKTETKLERPFVLYKCMFFPRKSLWFGFWLDLLLHPHCSIQSINNNHPRQLSQILIMTNRLDIALQQGLLIIWSSEVKSMKRGTFMLLQWWYKYQQIKKKDLKTQKHNLQVIFLKPRSKECFIYAPIFHKKDWMATFLTNIRFEISVKNMRSCLVVQSWEGCVYVSLFTSRGQRRNIIAGERCEHVTMLFVLNCKAASLRWKEWNTNSSSRSVYSESGILP